MEGAMGVVPWSCPGPLRLPFREDVDCIECKEGAIKGG